MKKLFSTLMAVAILAGAQAQPHSILVGGNVAFITNKAGVNKESAFGLLPFAGYQFDKNWTGGVLLDFEGSKTSTNGTQTSKSTGFGLSPFVRYTWTISDLFRTYLQADAGFLNKNFDGVPIKEKRFTANLAPYIFLNVKNGFGLNFSFGGVNYTSSNPAGNSTKSNYFAFTFGSTGSIGISKNFGGKK